MQSVVRRLRTMSIGSVLKISSAVFVGLQVLVSQPLMAQSQTWTNGPGSNTGKGSTVVPTNCVNNDDGSVTCDTKVENPPGTTPARPSYQPFNN